MVDDKDKCHLYYYECSQCGFDAIASHKTKCRECGDSILEQVAYVDWIEIDRSETTMPTGEL